MFPLNPTLSCFLELIFDSSLPDAVKNAPARLSSGGKLPSMRLRTASSARYLS
jgi:hypothetical protein